MNYTVLVGRLTKDIELRKTGSGKSVAGFTIAVNRNYKNENGNYEADFINCVAYNQSADMMSEYCHKGDLVGIKGTIQTRNYDDKDGKKVYVTEILVERVTFLSKKNEVSEKDNTGFEAGSIKASEMIPDDDDLPF